MFLVNMNHQYTKSFNFVSTYFTQKIDKTFYKGYF